MAARPAPLVLLGVTLALLHGGLPDPCTAPADIVVILDESGSISAEEFQLVVGFAVSVVENITIATNNSRVGLVTYSSSARIKFHLNNYDNKQEVVWALQNLTQARGRTYTGQAIDLVDTSLFTSANGDRPDVPNIVILVTDGQSTNPSNTVIQAAEARANGQFLFAIGVAGAQMTELQAIANDPDEMYVFNIGDFNYLSDVAALIVPKACAIAITGGNIVGRECTNDTDCSSRIPNTACTADKVCECSPAHYVYDVTTLACRVRRPGDGCVADSDCAQTNASCVNYACTCQAPFALYEDACESCQLGTYCPRNLDCTGVIPNSLCTDGVLTCAAGYIRDNVTCRHMVLGVDPCDVSAQCTLGAGCEEGVCLCGEAYLQTGSSSCSARPLGANCTRARQCTGVVGGTCDQELCVCGRAYNQSRSACAVRGIGEPCVADEDCSAIKGTALCAATSRCGCDPGYTGFDDVTCVVRGLGSACTTDAECGRSLSVCLQGACACQPGVLQDNSTCVDLGASSSGQSDTGAIAGGVVGGLAVLAAGAGTGLALMKMSAEVQRFFRKSRDAAYLAKSLDAMRVQTELMTQNVESVFSGMTPGCTKCCCSAPPTTTVFRP